MPKQRADQTVFNYIWAVDLFLYLKLMIGAFNLSNTLTGVDQWTLAPTRATSFRFHDLIQLRNFEAFLRIYFNHRDQSILRSLTIFKFLHIPELCQCLHRKFTKIFVRVAFSVSVLVKCNSLGQADRCLVVNVDDNCISQWKRKPTNRSYKTIPTVKTPWDEQRISDLYLTINSIHIYFICMRVPAMARLKTIVKSTGQTVM